jgi:GNAT superfamily N-acetyltransferase
MAVGPAVAQAARQAYVAYTALGNEQTCLAGAMAVRSTACPSLRDANCVVTDDMDAEPAAELLGAMELHYAGLPYRTFNLAWLAPRLEAHLVMAGYRTTPSVVMTLHGPLLGADPGHRVWPMDGSADWETYQGLLRADWRDTLPDAATTVADELARQAALQTEAEVAGGAVVLLGELAGVASGMCSAWVAPNGVGVVEDVFVDTSARRQGLATALLHGAVDWCHSHGATVVALTADPNDTPKHLYAGLGFRAVAVWRSYWREA